MLRFFNSNGEDSTIKEFRTAGLREDLKRWAEELTTYEEYEEAANTFGACATRQQWDGAQEVLSKVDKEFATKATHKERTRWIDRVCRNWKPTGAKEFFRTLRGNKLAPRKVFEA